MNPKRNNSTTIRWAVILIITLAAILIPFFLLGNDIERWASAFVASSTTHPWTIATVLSSLLASDVILPIPSSLTSTAAGLLLGFPIGVATSTIGMTVSCIVGYWIGRKCAQPVVTRFIGEMETERLRSLSKRFGVWAIVISRPIPVLAEASTIFAGISRMPHGNFLFLSILSNLGISAVYAAIGTFSSEANAKYSFFMAFIFSMTVPGIAMLLGKRMLKSRKKNSTSSEHSPV